MSISLEFYNLVIRRDRLEALLTGGWRQFQAEYGLGGPIWYDDDLVRFGTINNIDFTMIIDNWKRRGLRLIATRAGRKSYADMYPVAVFQTAAPYPCDWIELSDELTARFIGERENPRTRRPSSDWSDELVTSTRESILKILWTKRQDRMPPLAIDNFDDRYGPDPKSRVPLLAMKNFDDRFGLLYIETTSRASLIIRESRTGKETAFRRIDDLLSAGWAID